MLTIHLHQLEFFGYHGLHAGEALTGNRFLVSVDVQFNKDAIVHNISDTLDYAAVYEVVRVIMKKPEALLEMLAEKMVNGIKELDPRIRKINVSIKKMNAPIAGFQGEVGVTLQYDA